jgi:hypothetical protein
VVYIVTGRLVRCIKEASMLLPYEKMRIKSLLNILRLYAERSDIGVCIFILKMKIDMVHFVDLDTLVLC